MTIHYDAICVIKMCMCVIQGLSKTVIVIHVHAVYLHVHIKQFSGCPDNTCTFFKSISHVILYQSICCGYPLNSIW